MDRMEASRAQTRSSGRPGVHVHRVHVRFGDCDPAGIVYFPRFFDFFHRAMETWFTDRLALPYAQLIVERKIGFPAVQSEADFIAPTFMGDVIAIELRVGSLGHRSLRLDYRIVGGDVDVAGDGTTVAKAVERVRGSTVCVAMSLDPASPDHRRALPLPDDLRAAMAAFSAGADLQT